MFYVELIHLAITGFLIFVVWNLHQQALEDWENQVRINDQLINFLRKTTPAHHNMLEALHRQIHNP